MKELNKRADEIEGYKAELAKLHKQERAYEDAMEQLQSDLDTLEQENNKLKQAAASHERQGQYHADHLVVLFDLTGDIFL